MMKSLQKDNIMIWLATFFMMFTVFVNNLNKRPATASGDVLKGVINIRKGYCPAVQQITGFKDKLKGNDADTKTILMKLWKNYRPKRAISRAKTIKEKVDSLKLQSNATYLLWKFIGMTFPNDYLRCKREFSNGSSCTELLYKMHRIINYIIEETTGIRNFRTENNTQSNIATILNRNNSEGNLAQPVMGETVLETNSGSESVPYENQSASQLTVDDRDSSFQKDVDESIKYIDPSSLPTFQPTMPSVLNNNLPVVSNTFLKGAPLCLIWPSHLFWSNMPNSCYFIMPVNIIRDFAGFKPYVDESSIASIGGVFFQPTNVMVDWTNQQNAYGTAPGILGNLPQIFSKHLNYPQLSSYPPLPYHRKQLFCGYFYNDNHRNKNIDNNYDNYNNNDNDLPIPINTDFNNINSAGVSIMNFRAPSISTMDMNSFNINSERAFTSVSKICKAFDEMPCGKTTECIKLKYWCDGKSDCSDSSDEMACNCRRRIGEDRICDGYADCPFSEDEMGCYGCKSFMYSCYNNNLEYVLNNKSTISMCYSATEKCDGYSHCLNGKDEFECNRIISATMNDQPKVPITNGYLYRNYRGNWYPVCYNNDEINMRWAQEACETEGGHSGKPFVTIHKRFQQGPFIEAANIKHVHFVQKCTHYRNMYDMLMHPFTYVQCNEPKCGVVMHLPLISKSPLLKSPPVSSFLNQMRQSNGNISNEEVEFEESIKVKHQTKRRIDEDDERIVGGNLSKPMEWPFIVAIYRNGEFHCGGSIYTDQWIISAAHCVINFTKYYYEVKAGMLRRSSFSASTQIRSVSHIIIHQAYERYTMRNDLSLLRLSSKLFFNRWIKPICLPDIERTTNGSDWIWGPEEDTLCTAVGWGAVRERGMGSDHLRQVIVPMRKSCTDKEDRESEDICAGDPAGGRDACQGDSGGPLFCPSITQPNEWYLAGVVSHGNGCARARQFGAYTRVSLYLDWIKMSMHQNFLPKIQPLQYCPGFLCKQIFTQCISQTKRCDRYIDCLNGEDENHCIYTEGNSISNLRNMNITINDYFYEEDNNKNTLDAMTQQMQFEMNSTENGSMELLHKRNNNQAIDDNNATLIHESLLKVSRINESNVSENLIEKYFQSSYTGNPEKLTSNTEINGASLTLKKYAQKFICKIINEIVNSEYRCDDLKDYDDDAV